jgi:cysteine desulfurase
MDNSSTTKVDAEVINTMLPYFTKYYGNPSSIHAFGRETRKAVDTSRTYVADLLGAKDDEIIFTAGGTESDNLAIKGVAYLNKNKIGSKGYNIITSAIEHPAVLETCKYLEKEGFKSKIFTSRQIRIHKNGRFRRTRFLKIRSLLQSCLVITKLVQ